LTPREDTTEEIGETKILKRMGPKTKHWGSPHDVGNMKEKEEPEVTGKELLER